MKEAGNAVSLHNLTISFPPLEICSGALPDVIDLLMSVVLSRLKAGLTNKGIFSTLFVATFFFHFIQNGGTEGHAHYECWEIISREPSPCAGNGDVSINY